jgi:hypothetical protein
MTGGFDAAAAGVPPVFLGDTANRQQWSVRVIPINAINAINACAGPRLMFVSCRHR